MDYISGSYFKQRCKYRIGSYQDARSPIPTFDSFPSINNKLVFCKTEYLGVLLDHYNQLPDKFTLLTHNSDINIDDRLVNEVLKHVPQMDIWYAQNLLASHHKVRPLPIGLANPKWEHGNLSRFDRISAENIEKSQSVYVNFNIATNPPHRSDCLNKIGVSIDTQYPDFADPAVHNDFVLNSQDEYLRAIARSLFVVSPMGNGVDCHKTWESIYMKSVPIVINTEFSRRFKSMGIPMLILDDWSEFKSLNLNQVLYDELWQDFDPTKLDFNFFVR